MLILFLSQVKMIWGAALPGSRLASLHFPVFLKNRLDHFARYPSSNHDFAGAFTTTRSRDS